MSTVRVVQVQPTHTAVRNDDETQYRIASYKRSDIEAMLGGKFLSTPIEGNRTYHTVDDDTYADLVDIMAEVSGWSWGTYGGPGQWFLNAPSIKVTARNVILTQFGGYDV
jgi:hypothetical protein